MTDATIYLDLGSPYSYLAVERATDVLGRAPVLAPIVLGVIFTLRGHGSWGHMDTRDEHVAIVESRAREYGLPPFAWPPGWPNNTLNATRAALWSGRDDYVRALLRAAFAEGRDLSDVGVVEDVGATLGITGVREAVGSDAVKALAKERTQAAIDLGVRGAPTIAVRGKLFFGDDRLEEAAA